MTISLGSLKTFRRLFLRTELNILLKTGMVGIYQPIPWLGVRNAKRCEGTLKRWEAINNELRFAEGSVLDIGCDLGFFTFQMARRGFFCIGIESEAMPYHICNLIKEVGEFNNTVFVRATVDEQFCGKLPTVDVIIFLSVFHHIVRQFGLETSTQLMLKLMQKTRKVLFFETGQSNETNASWARYLPAMTPNATLWIEDYFISLGAARVRHLGNYETHLSPIKRSLFAVYMK